MKRFFATLLALVCLIYVSALAYAVYGSFFDRPWKELEPWFGEEPEIIAGNRSLLGCTTWIAETSPERISELAERLHAKPFFLLDLPEEERPYVTYTSHAYVRLDGAKSLLNSAPHRVTIDWLNHEQVHIRWQAFPERETEPSLIVPRQGDRLGNTEEFSALLPGVCKGDVLLGAWGMLALGPTLLVNAALLLLPHTRRRKRMWYLLPLCYAAFLFLYIAAYALAEGTAGEYHVVLFTALLLSLLWCLFSLLQSLLFGGIVRLCRFCVSR